MISEMTYDVLMGTLNPTHSLTHSLVAASSRQTVLKIGKDAWKNLSS